MKGIAATSPEVRVWRHVEKLGDDECCPWKGAKNKAGYGIICYGTMYDRHSMAAHRMVWQSIHGEAPIGMVVMHSCDNPSCCNPAHLSLGTHQENTEDCIAKGRRSKKYAFSPRQRKLSDDDIREIRKMAASGLKDYEISHKFKICSSTVWNIVKRKRKAHVPDEPSLA